MTDQSVNPTSPAVNPAKKDNPFASPDVQEKLAKQRMGTVLRDGPTRERFYIVKRGWNRNAGHNDGYEIFNGDRYRAFPGEQPLIEAMLAEPLSTGMHDTDRKIRWVVFWGHDNTGKMIITKIEEQSVTAKLIPDEKTSPRGDTNFMGDKPGEKPTPEWTKNGGLTEFYGELWHKYGVDDFDDVSKLQGEIYLKFPAHMSNWPDRGTAMGIAVLHLQGWHMKQAYDLIRSLKLNATDMDCKDYYQRSTTYESPFEGLEVLGHEAALNMIKAYAEALKTSPAKPAHWIDNESNRNAFWGKVGKFESNYGWEHQNIDALVHKIAGVEHLRDYAGKGSELLADVEAELRKRQEPVEAEAQNATQKAPISQPVTTDKLQAPITPPDPVAPTKTVVVDAPTDDAIDTITTIDRSTGEIVIFDPNRAIQHAKGASALVNRLVSDNVLVKDVDYGMVPGTDKFTLLKPGAEKLLTAFQLYDSFNEKEVVRDWKNGFFFYEYECVLTDRETGKRIGSGIGSCNSMEKKYRFRWVTKDRVPSNLKLDELQSKGGKMSQFDFAIDKAETTGQYGKPAEYWKQFQDAISSGSAQLINRKDSKGVERKAWEIDTTMYGIPNEDIFDLVNTISKMAQKRALVAAALNATGASAVFGQDLEDFTDFGMIGVA